MAPDRPGKRRSTIGVAAYLLVPGERRRRAAGHFGRAAIEAAKGVRTLYLPPTRETESSDAGEPPGGSTPGGSQSPGERQKIEIE